MFQILDLYIEWPCTVFRACDHGHDTVANHVIECRKMRYQLLDGELFYTLREAQIVIEQYRRHYNTVRPHSSLGVNHLSPKGSGLRADH